MMKIKKFLNLIFLLFLISCVNSKIQIINNQTCTLAKNSRDAILDLKSSILQDNILDYYKNSANKYDIIFYGSRSGSIDI
ncbi:hypothetical protein SAMN05443292_0780 [Halpernia frigidisoli]|uniref:Lipoprotein n=1 Tax=Halpernia frigidisoli TaxID=1125876 RepID=A0A1I3DYS3_9FLAO|nr:hypothetical protein SAMN05443292_0780 [Halpernia frigidisoli]